MPPAVMHLRGRKGGAICGARGSTLPVSAIELYGRRHAARCERCWRIVIDHLWLLGPRR